MLPVLLALTLSGCVSSGSDRIIAASVKLPPIPAGVKSCLSSRTDIPPGPWSSGQVQSTIARLIASEDRKTDCGQQLIKFYEGFR